MRLIRALVILIGAFLASIVTVPLLRKKVSKFSLYCLNQILGIFITMIFLIRFSSCFEEQILIIITIALALLYLIVYLSQKSANGRTYLKFWYTEPTDEDDDEYFSKNNMLNKPWWKFIFPTGWIVLVFFNAMLVLYTVLAFMEYLDWQSITIFLIMSLWVTPLIIWNAIKRKQTYDKNNKTTQSR